MRGRNQPRVGISSFLHRGATVAIVAVAWCNAFFVMSINTAEYPFLFIHPRHADWLARVLGLAPKMTRSDAGAVADLEFKRGVLPSATDLSFKERAKLRGELKYSIHSIKFMASSQERKLNRAEKAQIASLTLQIENLSK